MDLIDIKKGFWFLTRPKVIQDAICKTPPNILYSLKSSGKQCKIDAYYEPTQENKKVTISVEKTGIGGPLEFLGMSFLDKGKIVSNLDLNDIEPWAG